MSTPFVKEFDYDLWTTDDGRCWARVRATGEVTQISKEVMRILRREEKSIFRLMLEPDESSGNGAKQTHSILHPLSLEAKESDLDIQEESAWLTSSNSLEESVIASETERLLIKSLTKRQKDCYMCCIVMGEPKTEYAKRNGISARRVTEIFEQIQQKFKKLG